MKHKIKIALLAIFGLLFLCTNVVAISNPAANFCVEQGNLYEIRTDMQGNEYGVCVTDSGKVKDAWDFYRANKPEIKTQESTVKSELPPPKGRRHPVASDSYRKNA